MRVHSLFAIVLSICVALCAGCDDKKKAEEPAEKPDTVAEAPKEAPKPTEPAKPAEPEKPKAPEYTAEAAAKLITDMEKCEYDFNCDAFKPLVSFGTKVSADLAKFAADETKPDKAREIAAKALTEIKDPAVGMQMLEAAKKEKEFMLRDKLYEAAAAGGSDEVFEKLTKLYLSKAGEKQQMQIRSGLRLYEKKAFDWAVGQLPKTKRDFQVEVADIIIDLAEKEALETIQKLIPKVKHVMAKHRLASKAIAFGDTAKFDVLIKGLKSKDQYDRSDAANFMADVVKDLPADKKDEVVKLLQAAKKKDRGGLTAMGYDKCLKALEAK